jgi:hypothetical protein
LWVHETTSVRIHCQMGTPEGELAITRERHTPRVVFPAPRKPVMIVTGTFASLDMVDGQTLRWFARSI